MTPMSDTVASIDKVEELPRRRAGSDERSALKDSPRMSWKEMVARESESGGDTDDDARLVEALPRNSENIISVPSSRVSGSRHGTDLYVEVTGDHSQNSATPQFSQADDENHQRERTHHSATVDTTAAARGGSITPTPKGDDTAARTASSGLTRNSPRGTLLASTDGDGAHALAGSNSKARLTNSGSLFASTPPQSAIDRSETQSATAETCTSSNVSPVLEEHDRLPPHSSLPGNSMGHANTSQPARWSTPGTPNKMESPPTPVMDNKDRDDDGISVDESLNSSIVNSPIVPTMNEPHQTGNVTPLILPVHGTPSTAASTADEGSADGKYSPSWEHLSLRLDAESKGPLIPGPANFPAMRRPDARNVARLPTHDSTGQAQQYHGRSMSWGAEDERAPDQPRGQHMVHPTPDNGGPSRVHRGWGQPGGAPGEQGSNNLGANAGTSQSRVATFRRADSDTLSGRYGYSHGQSESRYDPWQQRAHYGDPRIASQQPSAHQMNLDGRTGHAHRHPGAGGSYQGSTKLGYGRSPQHTPPRIPSQSSARLPLTSPGSGGNGSPGGQSGLGSQRSQAEVLKTLLRKKACLYEPETSRAVALMAWLVGRELALTIGYFSRQQLQAGVHSCVADKIESGTITRTKVNRCMQIILNSCFHYIIPRPDGSEESGEAFRRTFAASSEDDSNLLCSLHAPWNNLVADHNVIVSAALDGSSKATTTSPHSSPRVAPLSAEGDGDTKRSVLLCFNENVRSASDVFRCHNEFIRDTAIASNLHLSTQEWRSFFGKASTASLSAEKDESWKQTAARRPDFFGEMSPVDLSRFRTTWCAKRYEHDHESCAFAHVEVNRGWLRRNPLDLPYGEELCPYIQRVMDKRLGAAGLVVNSCVRGASCPMAHSREEILYHPQRYKRNICPHQSDRVTTCKLADVCPHQHHAEAVRYQTKRESFGQHRQSIARQGLSSKVGTTPSGSPMLYVDPAPISKFEEHLHLPGLQSLFRRNCEVTKLYLSSDGKSVCHYTPFGEGGATVKAEESTTAPSRGLPSVSRQ